VFVLGTFFVVAVPRKGPSQRLARIQEGSDETGCGLLVPGLADRFLRCGTVPENSCSVLFTNVIENCEENYRKHWNFNMSASFAG
jgi:hypothetical protein